MAQQYDDQPPKKTDAERKAEALELKRQAGIIDQVIDRLGLPPEYDCCHITRVSAVHYRVNVFAKAGLGMDFHRKIIDSYFVEVSLGGELIDSDPVLRQRWRPVPMALVVEE